MFEGITQSLSDVFGNIVRGKLTEGNIREGLGKVRQALLEADVNYDVAKQFCDKVTEQAVGEKVLKSFNPTEQIVSIVYQELCNLMGPVDHSIEMRRGEVTVIMMCGLQGAGKTTTCGKLAQLLRQHGAKPMLVAADLQRPAAIEQLKVIGQQLGIPVHAEDPGKSSPVQVCLNGKKEAARNGCTVLILDTAGRLHVDDALMKELVEIDNKLMPHQVLLVCDAMTGQDAVKSAKAFNDALELDGVILTKLDGDTRGGAALSVKSVTGVPIKYVGIGEQLDKIQPFHPERMAQRILGQGDVATLLEIAQEKLDQSEIERQQQKMAEGKFTLDDFLASMRQIKRMGSMKGLLKLIPGMGQVAAALDQAEGMDPDKDLRRIEAVISSMTLDERRNPDKIDRSRRNRIAAGSGSDPVVVHELLKQFDGMRSMMTKMAGMSMMDRMRAMNSLPQQMMQPGAELANPKERSARGPQQRDQIRDLKKKQRQQAKDARKRNKKR